METTQKTVKLTRNCFAEAKPYTAGEIASFSPKIAAELISNRCAIPFEAPAREAATLPPVAETASFAPAAAKKAARQK